MQPAKRISFYYIGILMFLILGCSQDMRDQPRYEPYEPSRFFEDGRSERPLVDGVVPAGELQTDEHLCAGKVDGKLAETLPFALTQKILLRGRERFNIYCSVCHDQIGNGQGVVVQRGYTRPPTFHSERLRNVPVGHFFDVMTNGFGAMSDYSAQISVADRWAIAGYIRALQLSQNAQTTDVPAGKRELLGLQK